MNNTTGYGGSLGWTIVLALVIGVGAYVIGLPAQLAAVLAAAVGIAGAALAIGGRVQDARLPDAQLDLRQGARREIKQLSWTAGGARNHLDEPVVRRVRAIAVARLAARGIDLDDPRHRPQAEALLGRAEYRVLSAPASRSAATMLRCIRALDRLEDAPADTAPTAAPRPTAPAPERTA